MKVTIHEEWQNFVITPSGRFEEGDCQLLKEVLEKGVQNQNGPVLIDLHNLENITIAGQRVLIYYSSQLAARHRPFILFNVSQVVMAAFEASGLAQVILIAPGFPEAKVLAKSCKIRQ